MNLETPWMDAKGAAVYVGRKAKTAYKTMLSHARTGKIKAGYDGKTFRFKPEDLDAWMYVSAKRVVR